MRCFSLWVDRPAGGQDGETFVVPRYSQRVDASFGPVTDIVSNGDASYQALELEARRRPARGWSFGELDVVEGNRLRADRGRCPCAAGSSTRYESL